MMPKYLKPKVHNLQEKKGANKETNEGERGCLSWEEMPRALFRNNLFCYLLLVVQLSNMYAPSTNHGFAKKVLGIIL